MAIKKALAIVFILNLVSLSYQSQFYQDDILAFPRYKVGLTNDKVSKSQLNKDVELSNRKGSNVIMKSSFGQPFSCSIPNVQIEQEQLEREKEESNKEETEEDIQKTIERGLELLRPLSKNCIRFFASTHHYWVYEYCHNQYVRQFHIDRYYDGKVEKEQETASFYLGLHPSAVPDELIPQRDGKNEKALQQQSSSIKKHSENEHIKAHTQLRQMGNERFLVQTWNDGTKCDLTGQPRSIEVQYHCNNQNHDFASSFVELATCHYQIVISTPRLCEEMNLSHRHRIESHKIECRPIVSDKLIEQEEKEREQQRLLLLQQATEEEEKEKEKENQQEESNSEEEKETKNANSEHQQQKTSTKDKYSQQDVLLGMISDLTKEINQLKLKIGNGNSDASAADKKETADLFIAFDENGNIIPTGELTKLFAGSSSGAFDKTIQSKLFQQQQQRSPQQQQQRPLLSTRQEEQVTNDQHENRKAYYKKYPLVVAE